MNILEEIIEHKRREVSEKKNAVPFSALEKYEFFQRQPRSLSEFIRKKDRSGIIAEFKRRSPSKGVINASAAVEATTSGYADAGASGLSVLTDAKFFGGCNEDLLQARKHTSIPILRKDFTIDEYQIAEAKAIGADAILLIAAVLDPMESKKLADFAHALRLEVLLEVHNEKELLSNLDVGADLIGVNNRDLRTFTVSLEVSRNLASRIPASVVKVSESGLSHPKSIVELKSYGYEGFLIGENFMREADPVAAAGKFIHQLRQLSAVN